MRGDTQVIRDATFWLIERGANQRQSPTVWWKGRDSFGDVWVESVHEACQFHSKEAAEAVARANYVTHYAVTSHNLLTAPSADRAAAPAPVATLTDEELADCGLLSELDDGEAAEVPQAQQPAQQSEKIAPVQGYRPGIPWSLHLEAYDAYCKKWAPQPAAYHIACEHQNVELLEAIGYPHEKDTLVSAEEYAAELKRKADAYDVIQTAMSQDAQPVAWKVVPRYEDEQGYFDFTDSAEAATKLSARGWQVTPLYTHPPIPQEGKVMETLDGAYAALRNWMIAHPADCDDLDKRAMDGLRASRALLRSQVQGGLSTNNED
jgi:hypothetical protein